MITQKNKQNIQDMHEGGKILSSILDKLIEGVAPGMSTISLDTKAHDAIIALGCKPAFLGLYGFPGTVCISVNDEVVHGVPNTKILRKGDLLSLDIGLIYKGWYLDMAKTIPVLGEQSFDDWAEEDPMAARLIQVTEKSLKAAIAICKPGITTGDIGSTIQAVVESAGFGIVKDLAGHGIGKKLHEDPLVENWGKPGNGFRLKEGMTIAIEPIVTEGSTQVRILKDGFTYATKDGKRAAHFEHTIAITEEGCIVLTERET